MSETEFDYINLIKDFYCITDFQTEILDWNFPLDKRLFDDSMIVIGHPTNSHKGMSLGDIIPYTRLPEEIYLKYNKKVFIPYHFKDIFDGNPYIAGISNNLMKWGSLGTFGTTVQRTCNVWGIKTHYFSPKIYTDDIKKQKQIVIGINSNAGGSLKNKNFLNIELLKLKNLGYKLIQLATDKDELLSNIDQYCFSLNFYQLKNIIAQSEYYIGMHSSLYHIAKGVGTNIIGVLPENEDTYFVKLPFLTQCNYREIEMLPLIEKKRINIWKTKCKKDNKDPDSSHHIGWLYPDTPHLTMNPKYETIFVPKFNFDNILKAMNNQIYPFNNPKYYNYYQFKEYWI